MTNPPLNQPIDFEHLIAREHTDCVKYDARLERFGRADIIPLWVADMDFAAPDCVRQALAERVAHPIYGYSMYPDEFFTAIQQWQLSRHGWFVPREAIIPISGVVPALALLIQSFSQPGDGVLVQTPVYPPIHQMPIHHGRVLLENALIQTAEGAEIDWPDFEKKLKEARLFILCSPHNPVGRVWRRDELAQMAALCLAHQVLILVDEIHADLVFKPHAHIPLAQLSPEISAQCITLNAPSKTFNIAGLNTAYAITENPHLAQQFIKSVQQAGLGSGNVFGIRALIAAYEQGAAWLDELLPYVQRNRDEVCAYFNQHDMGIRVAQPEATFLMWLDCKPLMERLKLRDDKALSAFFIEKTGLGLNPGISFGCSGTGFMRLNIGCPLSVLKTALNQLNQAINADN